MLAKGGLLGLLGFLRFLLIPVFLKPLSDDGLITLDDHGLRVTVTGRFFLRNICMPFDAYLKQPSDGPVYSRTV